MDRMTEDNFLERLQKVLPEELEEVIEEPTVQELGATEQVNPFITKDGDIPQVVPIGYKCGTCNELRFHFVSGLDYVRQNFTKRVYCDKACRKGRKKGRDKSLTKQSVCQPTP